MKNKDKNETSKTQSEMQAEQAPEAAADAAGDEFRPSGDEEKVRQLMEENERLRDQMLRARAEFENFKRRKNQEFEQFSALANEGLITDILPVLDDLDLLIHNAEKGSDGDALLEGARMIRQKLLASLERRGMERIDAKGKPFDPDLHEALMEMPTEEHEPGTVVEVHQPGYRLGGRLLRPSRVIVAAANTREE